MSLMDKSEALLEHTGLLDSQHIDAPMGYYSDSRRRRS